jgi:hypothetical protein
VSVSLLAGVAIVGAGVALVVAGGRRMAGRPAPAASSASIVASWPAADLVELPADVAADAVRVRVTRSYAYVYLVGPGVYDLDGESARLIAVWRWSPVRRRLVATDRQWSPAWSRPIAERGWAGR